MAQVTLAAGGLASSHLYSITRASSTLSPSNPSKLQPRAFGSSRNVRLDNASSRAVSAKKKGWFDDLFGYGPDDEDQDSMRDLMSQGAHGAEDPIPARDSQNEFGYLDFPAG